MSKGGLRVTHALAVLVGLAGAGYATSSAVGLPKLARIAFENNGRILTMAADGSHRQRLTNGAEPNRLGYGDHSPDYSPDGSRIAFWRAIRVKGSGVRTRIEVINADGHHLQTLSRSGAHREELEPRWAPNGHHLAFTRYTGTKRAFTSSIVVMRDDGSHQQTIAKKRLGRHAHTLIFLGEPAWSPDGEHLIYTKTRLDRNAYFRPSLISINKRGADRHLVARDAGSAGFSPDGSQIVFSSIKDRNGSECYTDECEYHGEIYVADADGTDPHRLTDTLANETGADWSADGERIVFWSQRGSNRHHALPQVYSITPSGTCRTRLTRGNPGSSSPDWEPNPALSSAPNPCS